LSISLSAFPLTVEGTVKRLAKFQKWNEIRGMHHTFFVALSPHFAEEFPRVSCSTEKPSGSKPMLIRPITEAIGPITRLKELAESFGVEGIVRALDEGARVYEAGSELMASWSEISLANEPRLTARSAK
jgi:hypothetical protein